MELIPTGYMPCYDCLFNRLNNIKREKALSLLKESKAWIAPQEINGVPVDSCILKKEVQQ